MTPPAIAPTTPGGNELDVYVDPAGNPRVGNWSVADENWSAIVTQRHITSAVIHGAVNTRFDDALKVQDELHRAGVANVTIADN